MSTATKAHIVYELLDEPSPDVIALVEFVSPEINDPIRGEELGEQLDSLLRRDIPMRYVLDFGGVRKLGSTAFCRLAGFARGVHQCGGEVTACGLNDNLALGAAMSGLENEVIFAPNVKHAVRLAREYNHQNMEDEG
ncbi:hypothetical protein OJF2_48000 [Aquisphaera giovannonii]|uniref:STAS domain-containing protein n=1 Tax=Aquisphaera giovannonii TaxID=406548 RepID=A0A5B9W8K2_9BACT|nr:STAS domain-containing protein [Aquisphaera giovannonii]QEH36240.1 hypothetical protein OJF2_48000 [Aquisphaera giovannonii]